MVAQLLGRDAKRPILADEDVRVRVPSLVGNVYPDAGELGYACQDAGCGLDAFGLGRFDDAGDLRLDRGLRDRGPDTILVPTLFSEAVSVVWVALYPAVA